MILPAFINVNQGGIPTLKSQNITVSTTAVIFDFKNHRNVGRPYRGLLILDLAQPIPTGTTTTLPINFTTEGNSQINVVTFNNETITVADIPGTGVYLAWYESGVLQILTGI